MSDSLGLHTYRWLPSRIGGAPVILALHGTGGDENDLIPLAQAVAPDAAILSVRGNVLEHGAPRFFRRLAEGVFDLEDLQERTNQLSDFISAAATHHEFPLERLFALGFSNGANMAASLLLAHPESLSGGVLIRAMVPFEPESLPDLRSKRVLVAAGTNDQMIPRAGTERLADLLRQGGASVEVTWQAASHGLVPGDVKAAQSFFAAT